MQHQRISRASATLFRKWPMVTVHVLSSGHINRNRCLSGEAHLRIQVRPGSFLVRQQSAKVCIALKLQSSGGSNKSFYNQQLRTNGLHSVCLRWKNEQLNAARCLALALGCKSRALETNPSMPSVKNFHTCARRQCEDTVTKRLG